MQKFAFVIRRAENMLIGQTYSLFLTLTELVISLCSLTVLRFDGRLQYYSYKLI